MRKLLFVGFVIVLSFVFTACGGGSEPPTDTSPGDSASNASVAATSANESSDESDERTEPSYEITPSYGEDNASFTITLPVGIEPSDISQSTAEEIIDSCLQKAIEDKQIGIAKQNLIGTVNIDGYDHNPAVLFIDSGSDIKYTFYQYSESQGAKTFEFTYQNAMIKLDE